MTNEEALDFVRIARGIAWEMGYEKKDRLDIAHSALCYRLKNPKRETQRIWQSIVDVTRHALGSTRTNGHQERAALNNALDIDGYLDSDETPMFHHFDFTDDLIDFDYLVSCLDFKSELVVRLHVQHGLLLREIGEVMEVGESRICQIYRAAFLNMQKRSLLDYSRA